MANLLYQQQLGLEEDLFGGGDGAMYAAAAAAGLNSADDSLPYSTSELNAPEYSTDEFRMFQFKVARCSKRYVHDWRACPFAHPTENARRRDPRLVKYLPVPCPDYKRGICLRGDSCTYSHGVYECWLHPAKYRTQLCKEGPNCRRPVCFFAHSVLDLRQPTHMYDGAGGAGTEDVAAHVVAALAQQAQQQAAASVAAARRASVDTAAFHRLSSEEVLNNLQDGAGPAPRMSLEAPPGAGAPTAAALLQAASPGSRQASGSLPRAGSAGLVAGHKAGGSASGSPDRSGSPNTPGSGLADLPAARSAEVPPASDASAAMAVLTQQQQAQAAAAAAQAAAALARLSMDGAAHRAASLDAAAAAATTQAMLQHASSGGLPPRMSLDSLLASRQGSGGWAPGAGMPQATTAAAALAAATSTLPLNEQPFPSGNAPRMSNAVARKLGLAPQRTSLDARLTKLRGSAGAGMATPPRNSIDGILHALQQTSARPSLDSQQAAMLLQNPQLVAAAGLNGMAGVQPGLNGYGAPVAPPPGHANGYGGGPGADPVGGLHPALLSLVAAQMAPPQMPGGHQGMAGMGGMAQGVPNGMHSGLGAQHGGDANMAALVDSLNSWQLNGGAPGGRPPATMGHRGSMDGMTGMAGASGMPGAPQPAPPAGYYDAKGIWGSQEAINNQAGTEA